MPLPAIQHAKGFAYCPFGVAYFKAKQQWFKEAQPGDIVFFNFNGGKVAQHVGIVESVGNGSITTIEGNTGNDSQDNGGSVMRKTRYSQDILGYARPEYSIKLGDRPLKLQVPLSTGKDVRELQRLLHSNGYQLTIDGVFGKETDKKVREFQRDRHLDFDGIVGQKTLAALLQKKSLGGVAI